jgi:hypothetical protein
MTATVTVSYRSAGRAGNRIFVPISAVCKQDNGVQAAWIVGPVIPAGYPPGTLPLMITENGVPFSAKTVTISVSDN